MGEQDGTDAPPAAGTRSKAGDPGVARWIGLGVGAGIGSAAIAAALLYASRRKGKDAS